MIDQLNNQRLDKVLSNYRISSIRQATIMTGDKKDLINVSLAEIGMKLDTDLDRIQVNDKELKSLKIILKEGRNSPIRRRLSLLGFKVLDLQRVNFANFLLGNLKENGWKLININRI